MYVVSTNNPLTRVVFLPLHHTGCPQDGTNSNDNIIAIHTKYNRRKADF
ncbi:hypothetical protein [Spiroplasma sp. ChiS]|nr:hypothetical protein [Spiroplasma sp. ChiS]